MTITEFDRRKHALLKLLEARLADTALSPEQRQSYFRALGIVYSYGYAERLQMKGLLTRLVVDCFVQDDVMEQCILFDKSIT